MFINANSFKIDNINLSTYVESIEYQYPKLWGDDAGRNLAGSFNGTLLGVFPKFIVKFHRLTTAQIKTIASIIDKKVQTVQYYDPLKKQTLSVKTYAGDWTLKYTGIEKSEGFSVSFIVMEKR